MRIVTSDGQGNVLLIEETDIPQYTSLDSSGALATLLVVNNLLDIEDAANAAKTTQDHLVHEAQAWAIG